VGEGAVQRDVTGGFGSEARDVMAALDSVFHGERARGERLSLALKRAVDLIIASLVLVLTSPLMVMIFLAVRLTSRGPAIFRQQRIGYLGRPFTMLKFRTMRRDNDDADHRAYVTAMFEGDVPDGGEGGLYKLANDPRITRVGAFLRKTSLDELPQLLNVLRSDMSLVGPRPALPWEAELFEQRLRVRFTVKPGMTGLWQVRGRNALTMPQGLELDAEYVARRSMGMDLAILLRTIRAVLRSDRTG
jgi:lipopolysaccharide/colanic/teichoic acid biosynthesis glycosyltransferase